MNENITTSRNLLAFLKDSPTCFHAAASVRKILKENGYEELIEGKPWKLNEKGRYFIVRNESSVIAFRIPKQDFTGFMIGASHSDSPTFKIKANPEITENGYVKLNVEKYGGMLLGQWYDRPLTAAGRVIVKENNCFVTKLVNIDRDLLLIPHLAIHMDRKANEQGAGSVQKDFLPVLGSEETKGMFMKIVAEEAGVKEEDIIGHDLFLCLREEGRIWGAKQEYVSSLRLDDLQCGYADLEGFLQAEESDSVPVFAMFDNEEVGSLTKQGANSTFLEDVLHRICSLCGKDENGYREAAANSFMVSADNAHAVHPAHPEKADPVNRPKINKGIVLKHSANQKYTTDAVSAAVFRAICKEAGVPVQDFTNHSDVIGGSTLGNLSNSHVSLNTADIGLPQLAMHSCYETAGTEDTGYLIQAMRKFFSLSFCDEGQGRFTLK